MTRPKRKYVRLAPSDWAELRAYWESGDHGLAELSDRYGVSPRTIQSHLSKLGSLKGAKAKELAAVVQKEIFKEELGDQETITRRAKETREAAYTNAVIVDRLVMAQLAVAQKDPTHAFKAATAIKTLALAAATLERTQAIRLRALGLDKENAPPDEFPVLTIRDLNADELKALQERDEPDGESELGTTIVPMTSADSECLGTDSAESDDIIVEGDEAEEAEKPSSESVSPHGGRLVRGQLP
jgi:hypothetical protein